MTRVGASTPTGATALDFKQRKVLAARLDGLTRSEINKLYKQAAAMRKRNASSERRVSLDDIVLALLDSPSEATGTNVRRVTVGWTSESIARAFGEDFEFLLDGKRPVVGDEVDVAVGQDGRTWRVKAIAPRRTVLARRSAGNSHRHQPIVANVDVVCVVVSVVSPPLHPRLIDRYLIAIQRGGAEPLVCVNKIDLLEDPAELEVLEPYRELGVRVIPCSAGSGQGIEDLREAVRGKCLAFVGHSGVGKSSLANALFPALELRTGAVSEGYGRGTHTTTASQMVDLGDGTRVIDTPGIRSFGLGSFAPGELQEYFPEFEGLPCRFRDCTHSHEPDCAVQEAVNAGAIPAARYDTYLRLLHEASPRPG